MDWKDLNIREAEITDATGICRIYNQYLGEATLDTEMVLPEIYANFIRKKSEREKLYLLEFDQNLLAFSQIKKYSPKRGYQYTCETSTFFDKNYRNMGFGSKFKYFIIAECGKLGYKHIVARIMAINKVSVDYNLKLGYEIVGVQKKVGMVDGKWQDVVIMQYLFDREK